MDIKKVTLFLLVYIGEALIIISFLYFGRNFTIRILTLNIIVSSIIYSLFFFEFLFPIVDFKDKSHKTIGSLGLRWIFKSSYTVVSIVAMVIFNTVKPIDFNSQIIIQGILLFLLSIGLFMAMSASEKVHEVYLEEKDIHNRVENINITTNEIQSKLKQMKDIPVELSTRINTLKENLRFISPSNNNDAFELETKFLNELKAIQERLFDIPLNNDKIIENIQNCERFFKERKQIFSN